MFSASSNPSGSIGRKESKFRIKLWFALPIKSPPSAKSVALKNPLRRALILILGLNVWFKFKRISPLLKLEFFARPF